MVAVEKHTTGPTVAVDQMFECSRRVEHLPQVPSSQRIQPRRRSENTHCNVSLLKPIRMGEGDSEEFAGGRERLRGSCRRFYSSRVTTFGAPAQPRGLHMLRLEMAAGGPPLGLSNAPIRAIATESRRFCPP